MSDRDDRSQYFRFGVHASSPKKGGSSSARWNPSLSPVPGPSRSDEVFQPTFAYSISSLGLSDTYRDRELLVSSTTRSTSRRPPKKSCPMDLSLTGSKIDFDTDIREMNSLTMQNSPTVEHNQVFETASDSDVQRDRIFVYLARLFGGEAVILTIAQVDGPNETEDEEGFVFGHVPDISYLEPFQLPRNMLYDTTEALLWSSNIHKSIKITVMVPEGWNSEQKDKFLPSSDYKAKLITTTSGILQMYLPNPASTTTNPSQGNKTNDKRKRSNGDDSETSRQVKPPNKRTNAFIGSPNSNPNNVPYFEFTLSKLGLESLWIGNEYLDDQIINIWLKKMHIDSADVAKKKIDVFSVHEMNQTENKICPVGEYMVFPVHIESNSSSGVEKTQNGHWSLVIIKPKEQHDNVLWIDSLKSYATAEKKKKKVQQLLNRIELEVPQNGSKSKQLIPRVPNVPQQGSKPDCGILLLMFAEEFFKNPDDFWNRGLQDTLELTTGLTLEFKKSIYIYLRQKFPQRGPWFSNNNWNQHDDGEQVPMDTDELTLSGMPEDSELPFERLRVPITLEEVIKAAQEQEHNTQPTLCRVQALFNYIELSQVCDSALKWLKKYMPASGPIIANFFMSIVEEYFADGVFKLSEDVSEASRIFTNKDNDFFVFSDAKSFKLFAKFFDEDGKFKETPDRDDDLNVLKKFCPVCPKLGQQRRVLSNKHWSDHGDKCGKVFKTLEERIKHSSIHQNVKVDEIIQVPWQADETPQCTYQIDLFESLSDAVTKYNVQRSEDRKFNLGQQKLSYCWVKRAVHKLIHEVLNPCKSPNGLDQIAASGLFFYQFRSLMQISLKSNPFPILPHASQFSTFFGYGGGFLFNFQFPRETEPMQDLIEMMSVRSPSSSPEGGVDESKLWERNKNHEFTVSTAQNKNKKRCGFCMGEIMASQRVVSHVKNFHMLGIESCCKGCGAAFIHAKNVSEDDRKVHKNKAKDKLQNGAPLNFKEKCLYNGKLQEYEICLY